MIRTRLERELSAHEDNPIYKRYGGIMAFHEAFIRNEPMDGDTVDEMSNYVSHIYLQMIFWRDANRAFREWMDKR